MKKVKKIFSVYLFIIASAMVIHSCVDGVNKVTESRNVKLNRDVSNQDFEMPLRNTLPGEKGWFPEGSSIEYIKDGSVLITPPDGWVYVGKDVNGTVFIDGGPIEVSCSCEEATGCDPYIYGGEHCCRMKGECMSCRKSVSRSQALGSFRKVDKEIRFTITEGGFVNIDKGISFETQKRVLPMAFSAMFEQELIKNKIREFYAENGLSELLNYTWKDDTKYYSIIINLFGRRAILDVPEEIMDRLNLDPLVRMSMFIVDDGGGGGGTSCSCTAGNCTYKRKFGIRYCDSEECTGTCTLHANVLGEERSIELGKAYKY